MAFKGLRRQGYCTMTVTTDESGKEIETLGTGKVLPKVMKLTGSATSDSVSLYGDDTLAEEEVTQGSGSLSVDLCNLSLEDQADLDPARAAAGLPGQGPLLVDVGAAALDLAQQALLGQAVQGGADRFPADGQPAAQGVFRGDAGAAGKLVLLNVGPHPLVYHFPLSVPGVHRLSPPRQSIQPQGRPWPPLRSFQSVMTGRVPSAR